MILYSGFSLQASPPLTLDLEMARYLRPTTCV
jgi:hypothetical protein